MLKVACEPTSRCKVQNGQMVGFVVGRPFEPPRAYTLLLPDAQIWSHNLCMCTTNYCRVAQITNMHKSSSIRRKHGSTVTSRGVKNLCKLKNVNTGGPGGLCWDRSFCTDLAPSVARMAQSVHFGPGNNWVSSPACRSRVVAIHIARGLGC